MRAFIFAAGKGTRLQPITYVMPKALVPIRKKALLQHVIDKLIKNHFDSAVINIHHHGQQIIDYVQLHPCELDIKISDERESLLNTGGGLKKAAEYFKGDDPILIHNVDILSNVDLGNLYRSHDDKNLATLLVSRRDTKRYLLFNDAMHLVGWTNTETGEVKTPYTDLNISECTSLAFAGIHVISPRIFDLMKSWPDKFSIIDFYIENCKKELISGEIVKGMQMIDVGKLESLAKAELFVQSQNFHLG